MTDAVIQQQIIEWIETIVFYKFPNLSREELEAMLQQAKLEMMLRLLQKRLSMEQVAEILELGVETVRQVAQEQP